MPNPKAVAAKTTPNAIAAFFILLPLLLFYFQFKSTPAYSACNQGDGWFSKRKKVDPRVNLSTDVAVKPPYDL